MELSVLNSSFKRERLIENWNSLVWTERHSSNGDFQLVSNNIAQVLDLLPLGDPLVDPPKLVAIEDSDVPMVVESHKIEKPKNAMFQIVTTGRSFETVMDRRIAMKKTLTPNLLRVKDFRVSAQSAAIAAYELAEAIIVDGELDPLDIIPEIALFNSVVDPPAASQEFPVEPKELYAWMIETLALGKYGLKAELSDALVDQIAVIIYKGTDRSGDNGVVFDVALDQFEQASYLLSTLGHKNTMIVSAEKGMEFVSMSTPVGGLLRRVGFQNLESEVTANYNPALVQFLINKGKVSLADLLPTALFSGGVSADIGKGYNSTYFLGDIVKLQGQYGLSQNARVAEFIRTQDNTGTKAYPTFETVAAEV